MSHPQQPAIGESPSSQWRLSQHGHFSEKTATFDTAHEISSTNNENDEEKIRSTEWNPSAMSQFPWLGIGALFLVLCCSAGSIAVLSVSDGRSQTNWPTGIQPSVILAGLNNIANLCFSLAIANGIAIAWWRKALKGATIEELHKSWSFSSSVKEAVFAGKAFNFIALAALTAKLMIIDGMLMQDATTTYVAPDRPTNVNLLGWANDTFPQTGQYNKMNNHTGVISYELRRDLVVWQDHPSQLPLTAFKNCEGVCFFQVPAAGFLFDCNPTTTTPIKIEKDIWPRQWHVDIQDGTNINQTQLPSSAQFFNLDFKGQYKGLDRDGQIPTDSSIKMQLAYVMMDQVTPSYCNGQLFQTTCNLRPALLNYPVMVQNYSVGTARVQGVSVGVTQESYSTPSPLAPFNSSIQQQGGFKFVKYLENIDADFSEGTNDQKSSQLAGFEKAFNDQFGGKFEFDMADANTVVDINHTANTWLLNQPESGDICNYRFDDPMNPSDRGYGYSQSLVASINQIVFAVSTKAMSNLTFTDAVEWKSYTGVQYKDAVHYRTRWAYAAGAIASTVFCVLCVLPVYWGYWQVGRKVTLGPFEIAHAFRSPMTAQATSGTIEEVVKQVGHRQVQYGQIVAGDAKGVVGVAEPENVERLTGVSARKI